MLARAPVTHGTQQRHEVANAKCPSSREGPRWHSTCRKLWWRNPASLIVVAMKSLGSPTSQAQETNLISNHRWQLWIEVIQTDWTKLWVFISSHQFKVICLSHLSKKPEQFPSNWSCWAIPNGRHCTVFFRGYSNGYAMWTPKTPNLTLVWCKKSKQSNGKWNASTLFSNLFRNFCFTLTACAARKLHQTPISMDDTS